MNQNKVISSFVFKFIERIAVKGIGLVISIILARLLDPDTFGLLAIITVFVNLSQTFVQSGLGTALVQNRTTEEDDYSTVFYVSLSIALVLTAALWLAAPWIADYYKSDLLIWPLRVMALSLIFGAFNSVQTAKLQREMRFKVTMRCNLLATLISGVLGIAAAYLGLGLWALVVYNLSQVAVVCFCMLAVEKWRPRRVFSWNRAKVFFSFGWKMLVSSLLCSVYNDIRSLIIGKKYSTADLAYYNKGQQFPQVIANTLDVSIQSVMLPVMAREQDSVERLNKLLVRTLSLSMFIVAPVMLGLAAVSETLIPLLLTDKWAASIPLMCIFCVSDLMLPVKTTNLSLLKAIGRSDVYMKTELVRRLVMIGVLLITVFCFDSVMIIAIGYALNSWLDAYIIVCSVKKLTGMGWLKQFGAIWKTLLTGVIMGVAVFFMNGLALPILLRLVLQVAAGAVIYAAVSLLVKNEAFTFLLHKGMSLLKKKK